MIHSADDMERLVVGRAFLPFFRCGIPGLSIEEETPNELWLDDERPGPWEWKGPVIGMGSAAYGKFFEAKAGYIRLDWYPDFANYRRQGLSAEQATESGRLSRDETLILTTIRERHSLLTTDIRRLCGYSKPHTASPRQNPMEKMLAAQDKQAHREISILRKQQPKPAGNLTGQAAAHNPKTVKREGMETALSRLQMKGYLVVADFEYKHDKQGRRYGWGVARYCTPEDFYGAEIFDTVRHRPPADSYQRMTDFLTRHLPQATDEDVRRLLG